MDREEDMSKQIVTHLWYDNEAEEAAKLYMSIFKDGKIHGTTRYPKSSEQVTGKKAGTVMTVDFEIMGQQFVALNGGPDFKVSEAVSFMIPCDDQKEIDYYWEALLAGGGEESVCGWLKDKFGVSWQVVPERLNEMLRDSNQAKVEAVTACFMQMKKLELAPLEEAFDAA